MPFPTSQLQVSMTPPEPRPAAPAQLIAEPPAGAELRQHLEEVARDRDQAYRALQEREAELARVQRIGLVGGMEVDLREGFRNRRSPEYLMIHGLPPEAANETHQDWVRRLHPEDRIGAERHFIDALRGKND